MSQQRWVVPHLLLPRTRGCTFVRHRPSPTVPLFKEQRDQQRHTGEFAWCSQGSKWDSNYQSLRAVKQPKVTCDCKHIQSTGWLFYRSLLKCVFLLSTHRWFTLILIFPALEFLPHESHPPGHTQTLPRLTAVFPYATGTSHKGEKPAFKVSCKATPQYYSVTPRISCGARRNICSFYQEDVKESTPSSC